MCLKNGGKMLEDVRKIFPHAFMALSAKAKLGGLGGLNAKKGLIELESVVRTLKDITAYIATENSRSVNVICNFDRAQEN